MLITAITHAENIRLKVGIYNNPPIVFIDEKGTPQGVYVDVLNSIAQKENWTLDYVFGQWEELQDKIKAGNIDLITGIAYSQESNVWLDFNQEAFAESWGVVYAKPGASIRTMADLNGKRIALAKKDIHAGFFKQASDALGIELAVLEVGGYEKVFEALKNHTADAGVVSNGYGDSNAGRYGMEPTPLTFKPILLMVAFLKGRHSWIAGAIDEYLKQWKEDPGSVYFTSYQRWLGALRRQNNIIALTPEQQIWLANHSTIRVAFDGYFPPYSYLNEEGKIEGLAVDILQTLADQLRIRLEIHPNYVWTDLFEAAKRLEVDVVATMVHRPEREKWFTFTRPYIYKSLVVMTREDDTTIRDREDLAGKRVALVHNYSYVPRIIQDFPTLKPTYVDTMLDGLNAVATHNADAAVIFFSAGHHLQAQYGITNLKFAAIYDRNSSLESIGVRKDWPELAAILDKALVALNDTEFEELRKKWNSDKTLVSGLQSDQLLAWQKTLLILLSVLLGLIFLVFMVVISWNRTLRWKVKIKTQELEEELVKGLKAKAEIEQGKKQWETTFDAMSDWVCLIDLKKNILRSNAAGKNILGFPIKDIIGQNCCELIHGVEGSSIDDCPADRMFKTRQRETTEYYDPNFKKWLSIAAEPVFDEDGTISHAVHIIKDINERKELEAHLIQAQKMESIGTLTGGVAHDFNNIMGIILGNTELALEDVPKWNPGHANLEEIRKASLRAANIVKQLLSFSRITDQKMQPMEIATVIKDAMKFLRSTIPTTIDIEQDICVTNETILADPTQINQIMMNLCINASHAMEQTGGKLTISVEKVLLDDDSAKDYPDLKKGWHIKIMVDDSGPGIDPKIIGRIFDPYFTTKGVGKGSGMGLAVVHGIVKSHKGAIKVDSTLGKGTKFSILFPLAQEKAAVEEETIQEIPRGKETILFVDDEISIVNMVQRMFERLGYKVQTATTPLDALDRFALNPGHFDLVITDMTMPQMTGVNLSEKLMDIRPDIPIIICTGYSALVDEEKAKELGLAAYVMKPINLSEIAQTIRKVLDRK